MDRAAMSIGRGNWTSAVDMERLLSAVAAGACVSSDASRQIGHALEAQQIQDRLPRHLADGVRVANKTGNFKDVIHRHRHVAGRRTRDRSPDTGRMSGVAVD